MISIINISLSRADAITKGPDDRLYFTEPYVEQMTMADFVLVFLMGGVIILSTVGNDRSVTNCTCAVITIGLLHRTVSWAKTQSPRLGAVIDD